MPIALSHVPGSMYGIGLTCPVDRLRHQARSIQYSVACAGMFAGVDFTVLFGNAPISTRAYPSAGILPFNKEEITPELLTAPGIVIFNGY